MASSSPISGMTPLQASSAMGVSPSTPAAPPRPGNLSGAVTSTPLPSAVSPSGSLEGRSLIAASTFLAPTPTPTTIPTPTASAAWRGPRGASSGLHSTTFTSTPAGGSKSIEDEVDAFERALDELMVKGNRFYDQIESSLSPSSHPAQIQQALSSLIAHLDTLLSTLASSPLGSLQQAPPRKLDDAQQDNPSPSLDREIKALKDSSNDVYERRMRLAEAAGVVAHVLAINNAKRAGK